MMNSRTRLCILVLLVSVALVGAVSVSAASVTVRVGSVEAAPGEVAEVPITLEGSPGISAMHLELTYDPALLAVESMEQGSLVAGNALTAFNINEPGRIVISLAASDQVSGDGTLAVARFQVSGEKGQTSALNLEYPQAWDGSGFEVQVDLVPGQLAVGSGSQLLLLVALVILALVTILLVVLIFILKSRRRKPPAPVSARRRPAPPPAQPSRQPPPGAQAPTAAPKFCGHCGQPLEPGKRFCVHCGQPA